VGAVMTEQKPVDPWGVVFNTPLECGLRSAALLLAAYPRACDLQRLVQYDYLVVHSGDVEGGPPSIHPPTPHRSGELLVRRSLVEQGLEFMARRMVVERIFTGHGVGYVAGEYAVVFLDSLSTEYAKNLRHRATWVVGRFQEMADGELGEYMRTQWSHWGSEFVHESLVDEADG
jgi:hypothetical protein